MTATASPPAPASPSTAPDANDRLRRRARRRLPRLRRSRRRRVPARAAVERRHGHGARHGGLDDLQLPEGPDARHAAAVARGRGHLPRVRRGRSCGGAGQAARHVRAAREGEGLRLERRRAELRRRRRRRGRGRSARRWALAPAPGHGVARWGCECRGGAGRPLLRPCVGRERRRRHVDALPRMRRPSPSTPGTGWASAPGFPPSRARRRTCSCRRPRTGT